MNPIISQLNDEFEKMSTIISRQRDELEKQRQELVQQRREIDALTHIPVSYTNPYLRYMDCQDMLDTLRCPPCVFKVPRAMCLEKCTWDEIDRLGKDGLAQHVFSVGDAKTVHLTDGSTIEVRIIGFNHDRDESGKLIPISFETVQTLNEDYAMNSEWTNKGGWASSKLRKQLNSEIFNLLPDDLRKVIKPAVKQTGTGGTSPKMGETTDLLFLLSEQEIFGRQIYSIGDEGRWYEWYKRENTPYGKRKQNGEKDWRWERSPYRDTTSAFCYVYSYGNANYDIAVSSIGVSFGFCV